MDYKIIANIFSFVGAILVAYSTFSKKKEKMFLIQSLDTLAYAFSNLFIGSYSGVSTNILSSIRNYLNSKNKNNKYINTVFVLLIVIIGIITNQKGLIGYIPIIASVEYTVFSLISKNDQDVRITLCINLALWFIYDSIMGLYPALIMDIVIFIITLFNYIKIKKRGC